jgi:hypothetical protein
VDVRTRIYVDDRPPRFHLVDRDGAEHRERIVAGHRGQPPVVIAVDDHPLADEIGFAEMTPRDVEVLSELRRDAV